MVKLKLKLLQQLLNHYQKQLRTLSRNIDVYDDVANDVNTSAFDRIKILDNKLKYQQKHSEVQQKFDNTLKSILTLRKRVGIVEIKKTIGSVEL